MQTMMAQLNQASQESLNATLNQMTNQNREMINMIMTNNQAVLTQITSSLASSKPKSTSMVDSRGIGKLGTFKGDESKFIEWIAKLSAFLSASNSKAMAWMNKA